MAKGRKVQGGRILAQGTVPFPIHALDSRSLGSVLIREVTTPLGISSSGVEMESNRIAAVRNWPTHPRSKEVQRFLGFANYYRRFIRGFGQVVAPITPLLKGGPVCLQWSAEADRAFGYPLWHS